MYGIKINGVEKVEGITSAVYNFNDNKVDTFEFTITPNSIQYDDIEKMKTMVTVTYENGDVLFYGRALDFYFDFNNNKKIICEGAFAFFNDSVAPPYDYQGDLRGYIEKLLMYHNEQVEDAKRIYLREITVRDANDYLHFSDSTVPTIMELLQKKVIDRYGGHMRVARENGRNYLDYYSEIGVRTAQAIQLGDNLLDLNKTQLGSDIFTVIYPLGAKIKGENDDEERYTTIESVNGGSPFLESTEGIKKYGRIVKRVEWKDVHEPTILKNKAQAEVGKGSMNLESIEIRAVDKALLGGAQAFKPLRQVLVNSELHNIREHFLITSMRIDLFNIENNSLTVGKIREYFTNRKEHLTNQGKDGPPGTPGRDGKDGKDGKDVAISSQTEPYDKTYLWLDISIEPPLLKRWNGTEWQVVNSQDEVKTLIVELENRTDATIEKTTSSIMQSVSDNYYLKEQADELVRSISTQITQSANAIQIDFNKFEQNLNDLVNNTDVRFQDVSEYFRLENGEIELGKRSNRFKLRVGREKISFLDGGSEIAYLSNRKLYIADGEFINSLQLGKFAFIPRENGNLSFKKVGV